MAKMLELLPLRHVAFSGVDDDDVVVKETDVRTVVYGTQHSDVWCVRAVGIARKITTRGHHHGGGGGGGGERSPLSSRFDNRRSKTISQEPPIPHRRRDVHRGHWCCYICISECKLVVISYNTR